MCLFWLVSFICFKHHIVSISCISVLPLISFLTFSRRRFLSNGPSVIRMITPIFAITSRLHPDRPVLGLAYMLCTLLVLTGARCATKQDCRCCKCTPRQPSLLSRSLLLTFAVCLTLIVISRPREGPRKWQSTWLLSGPPLPPTVRLQTTLANVSSDFAYAAALLLRSTRTIRYMLQCF